MSASVFFSQQDFVVGDVDGNVALIKDAAAAAAAAGAEVLLTPELSLSGYLPEDLLYYPNFLNNTDAALRRLAAALPPQLAVLVGLPLRENGTLYNSCAVLSGGGIGGVYHKAQLPNFSVFDEKRYFGEHPNPPLVFTAGKTRYAVQICQDIWSDSHRAGLAGCNADAVLVPNGSPFVIGKQAQRYRTAAACARAAGARVFYSNGVGGQDELVFDGASFVMEKDGTLSAQLPAFTAYNGYADRLNEYPAEQEAIYQALIIGLRDYVKKSGFAQGIVLGLSGGADSALVAALAAQAVGAVQVQAIMMPTQYTAEISLQDAQALANALGIEYLTLPLTPAVAVLNDTLQEHLIARENDVTAENIQARLRGTLLMAISNNRDLLLLATGNKSEFASGYATLYGDMNGGFAPIKDVLKTQVWALCRYYNQRHGAVIPERIITRAPSAELRPQQTDQDSLPPYELLDAIIQDHLQGRPPAAMQSAYGEAQVNDFYRRLAVSEYKRRQAPPGTKISPCAFGKDWRLPVACRYVHA